MNRSNSAAVRNPILALPAMQKILARPAAERELWAELLEELQLDARARAEKSWRTHKGPMALYWKCVSVYTNHTKRALRARS